jgi:hypothetical protein
MAEPLVFEWSDAAIAAAARAMCTNNFPCHECVRRAPLVLAAALAEEREAVRLAIARALGGHPWH